MKLIVGILLVFAVGGAYTQQTNLVDDLLAAQADLALTHEFFETIMAINRGQLSSYMYRIGRLVIDSHMDTYAFIYEVCNLLRENCSWILGRRKISKLIFPFLTDWMGSQTTYWSSSTIKPRRRRMCPSFPKQIRIAKATVMKSLAIKSESYVMIFFFKNSLGQGLARCIGVVHNILSTWNV